jgi:predicted P-loop ATPase
MNAVLKQTAKQRTYHPVVRYLNRIRWDGEERIDRYLVDYLGATDTPLHRAMSRRWFVGCVARAMGKGQRPVKVDTVLILAGPQGARKSTSFRKLAGDDWFSDTALDIRNKDSFQTIRGVWIYELAELAATRPRDAETVKAFLSAETDRYRPPYARNPVNSHRQVVFVGTTNEASFLSDPTGARRFHPVTVGKIDLEAIERDRSMLWAEAVAAWKAGERWWLTPEEDADLRDAQEQFRNEDPWQAAIEQWMEDSPHRERAKKGLRIADVLVDVLEMDTDKHGKHHEMRLGGVLQSMKWTKRRTMRHGTRVMLWFPPS